ncbi:MAG: ABC transporter ATP-binding protein [Bacteroidales bacterium]|nr:ABC transporter ATP-binding protein [Bacteroidales bacterium]
MLIQLDEITKSYGVPGEASHQVVLNGLSFRVNEGDSIAILGPSGSGKSTLLNIIGTLDHPDGGDFIFKEKNITEFSEKELDRFRNREIGFVFQFHHLLPQCNLLENVMIPTMMDKSGKKEKLRNAEELLNRVGLWEHRDKLPGQLSGGECQRAAVVRSMINHPSVLLADEPTGALDSSNVDKMADLLMKLNRDSGIALILVTHSRELASRMNTIYELKEGKLHTK